MSDEIIVGLMMVAASLVTLIINSILQIFRDNNASIEARRMKVLEYKIQAYRELYGDLLEYRAYFYSFVGQGNEFKECNEVEKFAPLESNQKLIEAYHKNILYMTDSLRTKIDDVITNGCTLNNLAIILCGGNDSDYFFANSVEENCEKMIKRVDLCTECIKEELNLE